MSNLTRTAGFTRSLLVRALRSNRPAAAAAAFAFHAGAIALLMMPTVTKPRPVVRALAVFDVSASATIPDASPPEVPQPEVVKPTPLQPVIVPPPVVPLPTPNETIVAMLQETDASATGGACDLTEPVQAALQSSELVNARLPQIPSARRSVANAIMVWNAEWVALHEALDPDAMAAIRDTVAGTIAAASPECRLQPQSGPRLIVIPGVAETTVLALGSGLWRWQDLLETARPGWTEAELLEAASPENIQTDIDYASIARR